MLLVPGPGKNDTILTRSLGKSTAKLPLSDISAISYVGLGFGPRSEDQISNVN